MLTEKDYCDYETCVALKELGYVGQGRCYYDLDKESKTLRHYGIQVLTTRSAEALNFILAPHLYNAQKWLREKKKIEVLVLSKGMVGAPYYFQVYTEDEIDADFKEYDSYEEALSTAIRMAVEYLKMMEI